MTTCYRQVDGGDITAFSGVFACTGLDSSANSTYTSCCFNGNTCVEDSLCYTGDAASGSTGFFEALCTDPTFQDPSCSHRCTAYTKGDVVYDETSDIWSCCGTDSDGNPNCDNPTTVTFSASSPDDLLAQATSEASSSSLSSSSSATSRATSTRISQGTSTVTAGGGTTPTPSSAANGTATLETPTGLSAGAKAGIGIGAAVGVVAVLGLLVWIVMLYRRQRRGRQSSGQMSKHWSQHGDAPPYEKPPPPFTPGTYKAPPPVVEMGEPDRKPYQKVPTQDVYEMPS